MKKVISLGIYLLDILGFPVDEVPKGQGLKILEKIRLTIAGTAAGTAVDMAKLGLDVIGMGVVGNDLVGDVVLSTMKSYNIDTSYMVRTDKVQTGCSMLPIRPNGERPALLCLGGNGEFSLDDINFDAIKQADFLHMGGFYLLPKLDGKPVGELAKWAYENNVETTMDLLAIKRDNMMEVVKYALPYITYFMPNIEEASMLSGLTDRHDIISFFKDNGANNLLFKMGAEGSSFIAKDKDAKDEIRVPAYKINLVDSTGCGDAYTAGFITGKLNGMSMLDCCRLGSACGSLVATSLGSDAGIVDLETTLKFMENTETLPMTE